MKSRHQRCTLASGGNVATAEIGHHGYSCQFGQQRRIVQLHTVADGRLMPDGLPMTAYGRDLCRIHTCVGEEAADGLSVATGQLIGKQRGGVNFIVLRRLQLLGLLADCS